MDLNCLRTDSLDIGFPLTKINYYWTSSVARKINPTTYMFDVVWFNFNFSARTLISRHLGVLFERNIKSLAKNWFGVSLTMLESRTEKKNLFCYCYVWVQVHLKLTITFIPFFYRPWRSIHFVYWRIRCWQNRKHKKSNSVFGLCSCIETKGISCKYNEHFTFTSLVRYCRLKLIVLLKV